jgi:UDP-N-acetyl-D-galactosamine dehydrogenase
VLVHDPVADRAEALDHYGIELQPVEALAGADGVIVAVGHRAYRDMGLSRIAAMCRDGVPIVLDVKTLFSTEEAKGLGIRYGRL